MCAALSGGADCRISGVPADPAALVEAASPAAAVALTAAVAVGRAGVWESDQSPLTQLLFVPGLPALFALLGLLAGWRLWKRLWGPRVVKDKGAR